MKAEALMNIFIEFTVCFILCVFAASPPAPHQSCSSDCPPSQASDPPTDHSHVDPEGNPSSSAKEEQSVSTTNRGVTSSSIKSHGSYGSYG